MKRFLLISACLVVLINDAFAQNYQAFHPGEIWKDNNGVHINAHGGGVLFYQDTYYWFGEHKTSGRGGNRAHVGVHVYSSTDLYNWKDEGIALSVDKNDPNSEITDGCILERPKVVYNKKTDTFVMWFHLELKGQGYSSARTGVAVSKNVTGPYKYVRSYRPNAGQWPINIDPGQMKKKYDPEHMKSWTDEWKEAVADGMYLRRDFEKGQMARDMTVFVDDDGMAYHIHSSEENSTLHISELTDDYTGFTGKYARVLPARWNEAPAIFKKDGKYYLITSGTTGWKPNPARLAVADNIMGPWKYLGNPAVGGDKDVTFHSQSTYILPVRGKKDAFIYMGDRWRPQNAIDGRYIWLPIEWHNDQPIIKWHKEWKLNFFDQMGK